MNRLESGFIRYVCRSAVGAEAFLSYIYSLKRWYKNVRHELMDSWQKWSNQVDLMKCDSNKSTTTTIHPMITQSPRGSKKTQRVNQKMDIETIPLLP